MSYFKGFALFVAGILVALYIAHKGEDNQLNAQAANYRAVVIEKLIETKGDSTGGVTKDGWSEQTKAVSIAIDKLKVLGKISTNEIGALDAVLNDMSAILSLWDPKRCYYSITDSCFPELAKVLFNLDYAAAAPHNDARKFVNSANSTLDEYTPLLRSDFYNSDIKSGSELVSYYLYQTSQAIDIYLAIYAK